jgi:hypothetical protein
MGIEPAGKALPELENKRFGAIANPKCDWRAIFLVMRGNVELRETTRGFAIEFPMSTPSCQWPLVRCWSRKSMEGSNEAFGS